MAACRSACTHLKQEVHEAAVGLHLVLQLVEDDEGGERKPGDLWKNGHRNERASWTAPSWISSLIYNKGRVDRRSPLLTIGDRLGPARVRGRVIVHQIQVDSSHHGVQLGYVLAVGGEELVRDRLSADQIVTDEGKTITFYLQETGDLKLNQEVLVTHRQNCRKAAFRSLVLSS